MPHAFGYRQCTRHKFSKGFRNKGMPSLSRSMVTYRVGDIVDVVANSAIQRGMPHKFYHGKTGRIFNVTKTAVGVVVNKKVGHRIIPKKINVRCDHIRKSQSREAFKDRIRENDKKKEAANKAGNRISTKRQNQKPKEGHLVKSEVEYLNPLRFRYVF